MLENGTVQCSGYNADGECGQGSTSNHIPSPIEIPGINNVTNVYAGGLFSMLLLSKYISFYFFFFLKNFNLR